MSPRRDRCLGDTTTGGIQRPRRRCRLPLHSGSPHHSKEITVRVASPCRSGNMTRDVRQRARRPRVHRPPPCSLCRSQGPLAEAASPCRSEDMTAGMGQRVRRPRVHRPPPCSLHLARALPALATFSLKGLHMEKTTGRSRRQVCRAIPGVNQANFGRPLISIRHWESSGRPPYRLAHLPHHAPPPHPDLKDHHLTLKSFGDHSHRDTENTKERAG